MRLRHRARALSCLRGMLVLELIERPNSGPTPWPQGSYAPWPQGTGPPVSSLEALRSAPGNPRFAGPAQAWVAASDLQATRPRSNPQFLCATTAPTLGVPDDQQ